MTVKKINDKVIFLTMKLANDMTKTHGEGFLPPSKVS